MVGELRRISRESTETLKLPKIHVYVMPRQPRLIHGFSGSNPSMLSFRTIITGEFDEGANGENHIEDRETHMSGYRFFMINAFAR